MNYERKKNKLTTTSPKGVGEGRRHSETIVHLPPPHLHAHHHHHQGFEHYHFQPQLQQQQQQQQQQSSSSPPQSHSLQNYSLRHPVAINNNTTNQPYVVNEPLSVMTEPMSMGTATTDRFGRFVSEHEIHFDKGEVCVPSTCICFFLAFLFSFMAIMSGVYFGLNFFDGKHVRERVFKVQFAVHNQEYLVSELRDSETKEFKILSNSLKLMLDRLFRESPLAKAYLKSDIIAFERKRATATEVLVHFNVYTNRQPVDSQQIYLVLADEILNAKYKAFKQLAVDYNSLDVQERKWTSADKLPTASSSSSSSLHTNTNNPWSSKSTFPGMLEGLRTEPTPASRKCSPIGLSFCRFLAYNQTSYPNLLEHWNLSSVEEDFLTYKEIIDSECYPLAAEFMCNLLQPQCHDDDLIMPCRAYCGEFVAACRRWLPERLLTRLVCSTFPEAQIKGRQRYYECRRQPNCSASLVLQQQQYKLCDGVEDCADGSDEQHCAYCGNHGDDHFDCGNKQCVSRNVTCDGSKDCRNGADELNCLRLVPKVDAVGGSSIESTSASATPESSSSSSSSISSSGFLLARYKGRQAFVCSEPFAAASTSASSSPNTSHPLHPNQLQILGLNICNENYFEQVLHISPRRVSLPGPFTRLVSGTTLVSQYSTSCSAGEVYYLECITAKCGLSPLLDDESELASVAVVRPARPGYWPWYVKITLNDNYVCDGTLIAHDAVLVQAGCMLLPEAAAAPDDYQQHRNMSVVVGTVRYNRDNHQARRYRVSSVTSLKSSALEQRVSIVRLNSSVAVSAHVRPVCHNANVPSPSAAGRPQHERDLSCVLLQMNYDADQLQHRQVNIVELARCWAADNNNNNNTNNNNKNNNGPAGFPRSSTDICVEANVDTDNNNNNNRFYCGDTNNNNNNCAGGSSGGGHLYCRFQHHWHLFGIERRTISTNKARQLMLFEMLPRLLAS